MSCDVQQSNDEAHVHVQDLPVVEPEHMLSAGLWEDIALPALKKASTLPLFFCFCHMYLNHMVLICIA